MGHISHAAAARQLGKVCLVGCDTLQIDLVLCEVRLGERRLSEDCSLKLDGNDGKFLESTTQTVQEALLKLLRHLAALRVHAGATLAPA